MKYLTTGLLSVLCLVGPLFAATPKPIEEVDTDALTQELQYAASADRFVLVWWIPHEFWSAVLHQAGIVDDEVRDDMLGTLESYSMLAVVEADISDFGHFDFYDKQTILKHLRVTYKEGDDEQRELKPMSDVPEDVKLLQQQMAPVLTNAMGAMGANFYFFTFNTTTKDGQRLLSPYSESTLDVHTTDRLGGRPEVGRFRFPLDSLHIPRKCPNGEDAHISWKFCPWTGQKLPE